MKPDEKLDQLFTSRPIQPRESFAEETMERIRTFAIDPAAGEDPFQTGSSGRRAPARLFRLPLSLATLGIAATLVIGLIFMERASRPGEFVDAEPPPSPGMAPAASIERAAATFASDQSHWTLDDEKEWLALEHSLEDLDLLLDNNNIEILYLLSADMNL